MRRAVYSPKAYVFVRTDLPNGTKTIVDLTDYVVNGTVNRRVNQVSEATIEIRNPQKKWTQPGKPTFRPMDPITIWLQRNPKIGPVQCFTGFLDTTPYYQLLPGTATLKASCTLKKLLYTFWDQGLPATLQALSKYGWNADPTTGQLRNLGAAAQTIDSSNPQVTDSNIGRLIYGILKDIANWPDAQIHIEALPPDIAGRILNVQKQIEENAHIDEALAAQKKFLETILGPGIGAGTGSTDTSVGSNYSGPLDRLFPKHYLDNATGHVQLSHAQVRMLADKAGLPGEMFARIAHGEATYYPGVVQRDPGDGNVGWGLWQITPHSWGFAGPNWDNLQKLGGIEQMLNPWKCAQQAKFMYEHAASKIPNVSGFPWFGTAFLKDYNPSMESEGKPTTTDTSSASQTQSASRQGQSSTPDTTDPNKIIWPCKDQSIVGPWGTQRGFPSPHRHAGLDIGCGTGSEIFAALGGTVKTGEDPSGYGHYITIDHHNGYFTRYAHLQSYKVNSGAKVKQGQVIAISDSTGDSQGPHLHFEVRTNDGFGFDGTKDPQTYLKGAALPAGSPSQGTAGSGTGGTASDSPFAAAFATQFEFANQEAIATSKILTGEKSLMNDQPIFPFIQEISQSSLRNFQSLPDGSFLGFFPDYFGTFDHRKPYWAIENIEIMDGKIELTDDALTTHLYVVGATINPLGAIGNPERVASTGVATIFNMSELGFINSTGKAEKNNRNPLFGSHDQALAFLQRYGARPHLEDAPYIHNHYLETFLAIHMFMQAWARTFLTTFTFTFMPELYPGGRVVFPDHDLVMYIDEVSHSFSYESGFTTQANLSAPAAWTGSGPVSQGMIRSNSF